MLIMRWQYSLSLIAMTGFMAHSSSELVASKLLPSEAYPRERSAATITFADNSLLITKPKQPSHLLQQLNLTSEQQQQIRQIHQQYTQQIRKKRNNLAILQQQLSDMMAGTEPVELIRAKNQQLVTLRQEIGALRFESMLATREILTPQQRQKFREIMESQVAP